jgi:hypothetical protein
MPDEGQRNGGGLWWAVRTSFRDYVASLPDGSERLSRGATMADDGRIVFRLDQVSPSGRGVVYMFQGSLILEGHAGRLSVELRDPHVHVATGARGEISVASGARSKVERQVIAAFTEWENVEGRLVVPAPRLTWAGVAMLGDVYEVGELLDPVEIADRHQC